MKSKMTEDTLVKCLNFAKQEKLPKLMDETTKCWTYAIALVERTSSGEDYVIVKNYRGNSNVIRSFSTISFQIRKIIEIYPYLLYDESLLPSMKNENDIKAYLLQYYTINELQNSNGKLSRDKIKGLLIESSIRETKRMMDKNPSYIPQPIKIENKEEATNEKENTKEQIDGKSEEKEPKRKAGRPRKEDKGK